MTEAKDARELSNGHPVEEAYADYANTLKGLANKARLSVIDIEKQSATPVSKELKAEYKEEIASIDIKLDKALRNAPKERIAQVQASAFIKEKIKNNPDLNTKEYKDDLKKLRQIAISDARAAVGADKKKVFIELSEREWEAINKGAVSKTKTASVVKNMDKDYLVKSVIPKSENNLSAAKINRIKAMDNTGCTIAEIANALGISTTTVSNYLK